MKLLLVTAILLITTACSSSVTTEVDKAEWICSHGSLADYERRDREVYLKIRCKE